METTLIGVCFEQIGKDLDLLLSLLSMYPVLCREERRMTGKYTAKADTDLFQ